MITMPARTKIIAIHPTGFNFSLKNITASKTEKNTSPFAISDASDALACVNPTKYKLGAITAPQTAIDKISKISFLENFCFCFRARGLRVIADMIYTKDASKMGSTEETRGFANTDTEPNMTAASIANTYPRC